ncbi:uncharacterized protein A4U43_C08F90 [Asparagus officinalis]|nr:uncharacterized protein A4U43_C08F90 [Asparagus officinalis]
MQIMRINKSEGGGGGNGTMAIYVVKVSMDGAPYLRKIDLKVYEAYKDLQQNLEDMFKCFSLGDHVVAYMKIKTGIN